MINSPILDTIISLVVIYFLLSNLVIVLNEIVMHWLESRAKFLQKSLNSVFNDNKLNKNFTLLLYDNPNIDVLKRTLKKQPHYISAENFCAALVDVISKEAIKTTFEQDAITKKFNVIETGLNLTPMEKFAEGVESLNHSDLKELLRSFITNSYNAEKKEYDFSLLNQVIINWYNSYMDRVSGWFKSARKPLTFLLSVVVAIILNVDSMGLVKNLITNKTLRDKLVEKAYSIAEHETNEDYKKAVINRVDTVKINQLKKAKAEQDSIIRYAIYKNLEPDYSIIRKINIDLKKQEILLKYSDSSNMADSSQYNSNKPVLLDNNLRNTLNEIEELNLPIGWKKIDCDNCSTTVKIHLFLNENKHFFTFQTYFGWLITSFALMLGAPFWFEVIKKLVNIRSSGKNPAETIKK
jgi:hypothetical protein